MKRTLFLAFLLILALPASAQFLTRPEIESDLGPKSSYNKQEVVDLIYGYGLIFDEELAAAEVQIKADADARFEAWKVAYKAGLEQAEKAARATGTERDVLWIAQTIVGAGLIVYGVYRNDVGTAATGVLMTGAGAVRLIIALE